ncbi:MAG: hypothetical protein ACR650_16770 [Methylocystis sp.]|jgi:hypothetical protein
MASDFQSARSAMLALFTSVCVAFTVGAAQAQPVINPTVLAPASRDALPCGGEMQIAPPDAGSSAAPGPGGAGQTSHDRAPARRANAPRYTPFCGE